MVAQKTVILIPGVSYLVKNHETGNYLSYGDGNTVVCKRLTEDSLGKREQWILDVFESQSDGTYICSLINRKNGYRLFMQPNDYQIVLSDISSTSSTTAGWLMNKNTRTFTLVNAGQPAKLLKEDHHNKTVAAGDSSSVEENEKWEFYFADIEFTSTVAQIEYEDLTLTPTNQRTLLQSGVIANISSVATANVDVNISKGMASTFEWKFTESVTLGFSSTSTIEGDVGVPGVIGGKATESFQLSASATLGSELGWTINENVQYSVSMTVSVPPTGNVTYSGYVTMLSNIKTPFTARFKITARAVANDMQLSGLQIFTIMSEQSNQTIDQLQKTCRVGKHSVDVTEQGDFTGSYGVETSIEIQDN